MDVNVLPNETHLIHRKDGAIRKTSWKGLRQRLPRTENSSLYCCAISLWFAHCFVFFFGEERQCIFKNLNSEFLVKFAVWFSDCSSNCAKTYCTRQECTSYCYNYRFSNIILYGRWTLHCWLVARSSMLRLCCSSHNNSQEYFKLAWNLWSRSFALFFFFCVSAKLLDKCSKKLVYIILSEANNLCSLFRINFFTSFHDVVVGIVDLPGAPRKICLIF